MAENKTKAIQASVADYLNAITDDARRADCVRRLSDVDHEALGALIRATLAQRRR